MMGVPVYALIGVLACVSAAKVQKRDTVTVTYPTCKVRPTVTITLDATTTYCPLPTTSPPVGSGYPASSYVQMSGTTVYTTVIPCPCETEPGMCGATYTITEPCPCTQPWSHVPPPDFTTTVYECSYCGPTGGPSTITQTLPCETGAYATVKPGIGPMPPSGGSGASGHSDGSGDSASPDGASGSSDNPGDASQPGSAGSGGSGGSNSNVNQDPQASGGDGTAAGSLLGSSGSDSGDGSGDSSGDGSGSGSGDGSGNSSGDGSGSGSGDGSGSDSGGESDSSTPDSSTGDSSTEGADSQDQNTADNDNDPSEANNGDDQNEDSGAGVENKDAAAPTTSITKSNTGTRGTILEIPLCVVLVLVVLIT